MGKFDLLSTLRDLTKQKELMDFLQKAGNIPNEQREFRTGKYEINGITWLGLLVREKSEEKKNG